MPNRRWKRLAVSVLASVALLGALELVLRAAEPGPFTFTDENPYLADEVLRHKHRPGFRGHWEGTWFEINSLGMRGPEITLDKQPGEFRVVALGDSCTFGKSVEEEETWPRQLEGLLAARMPEGRFARVANLGVNGFAGHEYHELFFRLGLGLRPDVVLVGYNLNDFPNVIQEVDQAVYKRRGLRRAISQDLRDSLGRTALYRWVRATYYEAVEQRDWQRAEAFARAAAGQGSDPQVWAEQERFLGEIVAGARENGAEVVVFLFPYESQVYLDSYDTTPIRMMTELCARLEVPFMDLATRFREHAAGQTTAHSLFVRGDRYHPTGEGYGIVASAVLEILDARGLLPGDG